jgi:hypothetical protein
MLLIGLMELLLGLLGLLMLLPLLLLLLLGMLLRLRDSTRGCGSVICCCS